jgi:hypothetical protein
MSCEQLNNDRREFIKGAGANAQAPPAAFDISTTFTGFIKDIGGTPDDGGGKASFTGEDPILRSHFRIGTATAPMLAKRRGSFNLTLLGNNSERRWQTTAPAAPCSSRRDGRFRCYGRRPDAGG